MNVCSFNYFEECEIVNYSITQIFDDRKDNFCLWQCVLPSKPLMCCTLVYIRIKWCSQVDNPRKWRMERTNLINPFVKGAFRVRVLWRDFNELRTVRNESISPATKHNQTSWEICFHHERRIPGWRGHVRVTPKKRNSYPGRAQCVPNGLECANSFGIRIYILLSPTPLPPSTIRTTAEWQR